MKKLISLLLAMLMIFSIATVAFAAEEPADPQETTTEETQDEDSGFNFEDITLWEAKFGLKVGKILLKLVKAFVKVALALRLIDREELNQKVLDLFGLIKDQTSEAPAEPAVE